MKRVLAIILTVGLLATVAVAQPDLILVNDRDNANDTLAPLNNYGRKCNVRWAKNKQETTLYCDWDDGTLDQLRAMISGLDPDDYTVEFCVTGVTWEGPNPANVVWVETFRSVNDWVNDESCDNTGPNPDVGACHLYADSTTVPETNWIDPDTSTPGNFWAMPARLNSVPFVGYVPSTGPGDNPTMKVVLDQALVDDLLSDRSVSNVRGLRCWSEQWNNHQVYARGQWGCPGAAAPQLHLTLGGGPVLPYPGDATDDGKVDGADYTVWADNYGMTDAPLWSAGGWTVGNFTEDTNVDGADYTVWADEYGYGTGGAAVPEPVTLALLAMGAVVAIRRRK
jgi:hypothetical protein